jgi:hypothetical protein
MCATPSLAVLLGVLAIFTAACVTSTPPSTPAIAAATARLIEARTHERICGAGRHFDGDVLVFPRMFREGPGWAVIVDGYRAYYVRGPRLEFDPLGGAAYVGLESLTRCLDDSPERVRALTPVAPACPGNTRV